MHPASGNRLFLRRSGPRLICVPVYGSIKSGIFLQICIIVKYDIRTRADKGRISQQTREKQ